MTIYTCYRCARIIDTNKPPVGWRIDDIIDGKPQVLCSVCAWGPAYIKCPCCSYGEYPHSEHLEGGYRLRVTQRTCEVCEGKGFVENEDVVVAKVEKLTGVKRK